MNNFFNENDTKVNVTKIELFPIFGLLSKCFFIALYLKYGSGECKEDHFKLNILINFEI